MPSNVSRATFAMIQPTHTLSFIALTVFYKFNYVREKCEMLVQVLSMTYCTNIYYKLFLSSLVLDYLCIFDAPRIVEYSEWL